MVHGAFNELWGPNEIKARWLPALRDGLWHHGGTIHESEVGVAFYGDLFRRDPNAADADEFERSKRQIAQQLPELADEHALTALGQATSDAVYDRTLDMIATMATDPGLTGKIIERVATLIEGDTSVLIRHSLGSIVAYEALRRHPEWPVGTLITLGSPLGQSIVLSTIVPAADGDSGGSRPWPGSVDHWVNVAAVGDKPAAVWNLAAIYGERVRDVRVDNGHRAHAPEPYLNAHQTGRVLADALGAGNDRSGAT